MIGDSPELSTPLPAPEASPVVARWRRARTHFARFVILPLAIAYSLALLVGGTPEQIRPAFLDRPHLLAMDFFARLHTLAGLPLFTGSGTSDYRRKGMCWVAVGVLSDGSQKTLYESYDRCVFPTVRVFNRDFDTFMQRAFWEELRSLRNRKAKFREPVVDTLRRSHRMGNVSKYFCASSLEQGQSVATLHTVWRYSSVRYSDGKVFPLKEVVHSYDCREKRSLSEGPWPKVKVDKHHHVHLVWP